MAKAFESPLISHARMRALYRALVEVRGLRERLGDVDLSSARGLEASLVSTAIDLHPDDLTSSAGGESLPDYVRALSLRTGNGAASSRTVKRLLALPREAATGSAADRLLCAVGMAMALKARTAHGVAIAYADATDLKSSEWTRVLGLAAAGEIPLVLVVTPATGSGPHFSALARRASPDGRIPVIPVDAADAVALYRVAQESIVRARADRRAAVIACVATGDDPIALLGAQLIAKGICTERWISGVAASFARLLPPAPTSRRRSASRI